MAAYPQLQVMYGQTAPWVRCFSPLSIMKIAHLHPFCFLFFKQFLILKSCPLVFWLRSLVRDHVNTFWKTQISTGSPTSPHYLLSLKPLLELHTELLWCVCSGPHHICSGMHTLQWKIALLTHHGVKGWLLTLHATKASRHCCSLPWIGLTIHWRLLVNHNSRLLAMKWFLFWFQHLSL